MNKSAIKYEPITGSVCCVHDCESCYLVDIAAPEYNDTVVIKVTDRQDLMTFTKALLRRKKISFDAVVVFLTVADAPIKNYPLNAVFVYKNVTILD